jgi:hypothetical protein
VEIIDVDGRARLHGDGAGDYRVKLVYVITMAIGWGYIGQRFHWPQSVAFVAAVMARTFAFDLGRVIEDDRR